MEKLTSTEGMRWAFLKWTWVPYDAPPLERRILRLRFIQTPLFSVFVHKHFRPDPEQDLHDHPYSFCRLILKGGYIEDRVAALPLLHRAPSWRYMKAEWPHAIRQLLRVPTWSVLLIGRRRRNWGYHTNTGWVHHEDYT